MCFFCHKVLHETLPLVPFVYKYPGCMEARYLTRLAMRKPVKTNKQTKHYVKRPLLVFGQVVLGPLKVLKEQPVLLKKRVTSISEYLPKIKNSLQLACSLA